MSLLLLLTLLALSVYAGYDEFFFATNANDTATCPGLVFGCQAPKNVCAHDAVLDKYYCCSGSDYPICRAFASDCDGSNGDASSSQLPCSGSGAEWCCLDSTEKCTQRTGQTNICLATQDNVLANVSPDVLSAAYTSLSSADPSATSLNLDATRLAVAATASTTSSLSSTPSVSTTSTVSASSTTVLSTPSASGNSDSGADALSSGAIAGIVIGCVGGLGAVAVVAFFLIRKRQGSRQWQPPDEGPFDKQEGYSDTPIYGHASSAPQYTLAELGEPGRHLGELPAERQMAAELPDEPKELPSSRM